MNAIHSYVLSVKVRIVKHCKISGDVLQLYYRMQSNPLKLGIERERRRRRRREREKGGGVLQTEMNGEIGHNSSLVRLYWPG